MTIIIRRPWQIAPQDRARIAEKWRSEVGFATFTGIGTNRADLVTGEIPTRVGTCTTVATTHGLAAKSDNASNRYSFAAANPVKSVADGYAILVIAAPIAESTIRRTVVIGPEAASAYTATQFIFNISASTGSSANNTSTLYEYSGGNYARCQAFNQNDGGLKVYLANRLPGNTAPRMIVNGINRTGLQYSADSSYSIPAGVHIHSSSGVSSSAGMIDPLLFVAVFRRALTEAEEALFVSPAAVFAELLAPRQIIVPVAAASGYTHPTLSNARMDPLTATGGVPNVDYAF